jgi:D-glycero-D-manno-heptose 1,7-bisphosphate phosphatase
MKHAAVFLDRDGTLIEDKNYLADKKNIVWLPNVFKCLKKFRNKNYHLIIISNQSGIGRGFLSEDDYQEIKEEMCRQARKQGIVFKAVYHCPHNPEKTDCPCRKPKSLLFERAIREHDIDARHSLAIGDRERDLEPARRLGVKKTHLVVKNQGLGDVLELL